MPMHAHRPDRVCAGIDAMHACRESTTSVWILLGGYYEYIESPVEGEVALESQMLELDSSRKLLKGE
jgi:hypothetical protein